MVSTFSLKWLTCLQITCRTDFSRVSRLSQSRTFYDYLVWEEVHFAIQLLQFFSCWTLYVLAWTTLWVLLLINNPDLLDRNPFGVWFLVLIPIARGAAFFYESKSHGLQDVEFDEWYSGLYGDIILFEGSAFYVHYRSWTVCCILGLGLLPLPTCFLAPIDSWLFFAAVLIEFEAGVVVVKWFLELCAVATPRSVNLPL